MSRREWVSDENVILISNHQTEADPATIALLLETTSPYISENAIYVAGERVLTDPLCKPFSMGRNLLCVYSKKHTNDVPELAEIKRMANTRTLGDGFAIEVSASFVCIQLQVAEGTGQIPSQSNGFAVQYFVYMEIMVMIYQSPPKIDYNEVTASSGGPEEAKEAYPQHFIIPSVGNIMC
ncbi:glycerol-3-phosphate acyltransferase [Tanacetum coccineum]